MGQSMLESDAISAFCGSVASMFSVGIQLDEALSILEESSTEPFFTHVCNQAYQHVVAGDPLSVALAHTRAFPQHVIRTLEAGEQSGRAEEVLHSLATYYDEESRLFTKMRQSVRYPMVLFFVMAIIIAFTVLAILPVFSDVYESFAGDLAASSYGSLNISVVIGWLALAITALCAVLSLVGFLVARGEAGRLKLMQLFEKLPLTRKPLYHMALSRFAGMFAVYSFAGANVDESMKQALKGVEHASLGTKLEETYQSMLNQEHPLSFSQAIVKSEVFEASHLRMLAIGASNGNLSGAMEALSGLLFEDAVNQIDATIDKIEPIMAAFLAVAIGATLISVMLPLIGIVGSLG